MGTDCYVDALQEPKSARENPPKGVLALDL
jgi:hypothetical protein